MKDVISTLNGVCSGMSERIVPQSMRSLAWRRGLVVAAYGFGAVTLAWAWADWGDAISLPAILATVAFSMYWAAIHGLTDRPDSAVDERERMVRNDAHRIGFQILAWLGFPLAVAMAAVFPERSLMQSLWAFVTAWLMAWGLPAAVVAWSQPEEPAGE
ncbi:MAG TPA: hypothetical protein VIB47_07880 [Dehalococcoidia bacterium]|jgi:uncharacterized membrane protein